MALPAPLQIMAEQLAACGMPVAIAVVAHEHATRYRVLYGHRHGQPVDRTYDDEWVCYVALDAYLLAQDPEVTHE